MRSEAPTRRHRIWRVLALLGGLGLACAGSPDEGEPDDGAFRIPVTVQTDDGPVTFRAEVADEPAERARGLMFREFMPERQGMLFIFPGPAEQSFWMRNTLIPLDMIFIRSDRTILGVLKNAEPRTDTPRAVPGESQYVLEINGGLSDRYGIGPDQTVQFVAPMPER